MKGRIRAIRNTLGLNQTEFGEKVGVKGNTIGNYETGLRNPSDAVIFSICREFSISEDWIRNGTGEMFVQLPVEDEYFRAATEISKSNDKLAMQAVIEYWKLDDDGKKLLKDFIVHIAEKSKE